jgi:hypothetical protein
VLFLDSESEASLEALSVGAFAILPPSANPAEIIAAIRMVADGLVVSRKNYLIVPLGLGGNLLFERASCKACAKITGKVEQACLRTMFAPLRVRMGFPTRRPKEQKREEPLFVITLDGRTESKSITLLEHPAAICLMRIEPPRLLFGLPTLRDKFNGDLWWTVLQDDATEKIKQHGGKGLRIASFNPALFARMLAKIAHAFAVAEQGFDKITPLLPEIIRGETDNFADLIGGDMLVPPAVDALHRLHLEVGWKEGVDYTTRGLPGDIQFLVVHVRLFALLGTPQYHVVVGCWNTPRGQRNPA